MQIVNTVELLKAELSQYKAQGKTIGFVPTMGAIHQGHLSLVQMAKNEGHVVVASIFVNPIQFNNPEDFEKYPRTVAADAALMEPYVDLLFVPSEKEMYPTEASEVFHFQQLEQPMEGAKRPGHFQGVLKVVKRLFDYTTPHVAYFGEKDFQQLALVTAFAKQYFPTMQIKGAPIIREQNGLAMSSRNQRLTEQQRDVAAKVYQILTQSKHQNKTTPTELQRYVLGKVKQIDGVELEYFEIVNAKTLQPVNSFEQHVQPIGCVAFYVNGVRLIDNIKY